MEIFSDHYKELKMMTQSFIYNLFLYCGYFSTSFAQGLRYGNIAETELFNLMIQNLTKLHNEWKGEQERVLIVVFWKNITHVETKYIYYLYCCR